MSNQLPRAFTRALVLALFVLTCFSAALAQTRPHSGPVLRPKLWLSLRQVGA